MSTNSRVTRASNKDTHPGMPDVDEEVLGRVIPKPRRTKMQIAADNAATAEKKSAKAQEAKLNNEKRALLVERIATLEKKMEDDEQQAEREAAHPPVKKSIVSVAKPPSKCTQTHLLFKCVAYY
jgi:hypothetical protein